MITAQERGTISSASKFIGAWNVQYDQDMMERLMLLPRKWIDGRKTVLGEKKLYFLYKAIKELKLKKKPALHTPFRAYQKPEIGL